MLRCVWHEEDNPSMSLRTGRDGILIAHCFGCNESGTILALVAAINGLSTSGSDFVKVVELAAEMVGGVTAMAPMVRAPAAPPEYPPREEVALAWLSAHDQTTLMDKWVASRGLGGRHLGIKAFSTEHLWLPGWCSYWQSSGHVVLIPTYDFQGIMRSLRGRATRPSRVKEVSPTGFSSKGLAMANPTGLSLLRGASNPRDAIICEGAPDFLSWYGKPNTAVFGIFSGSWSQNLAISLRGMRIEVRTHLDVAGEMYYREIASSMPLGGGTTVIRSTLDHGYKDDNEALQNKVQLW